MYDCLLQTTNGGLSIREITPGHWYQFRVSAVNQHGSRGASEPTQAYRLSRGQSQPTQAYRLSRGQSEPTQAYRLSRGQLQRCRFRSVRCRFNPL